MLRLWCALLVGIIALPTTKMSLAQTGASIASGSHSLRNPTDPAAIFEYAQEAAELGNFRTAIAALERLLILQPSLNNIKLELGVLYLRNGQPALAQQLIEQALADPNAPASVRARAQDLLENARRGTEPSRSSGQLIAKINYDTNANDNPEGVTPGPTSDLNASVWLGGRYNRDLGYQAGHQFVADWHLFASEYRNLSDEDTLRGALGFGVEWGMDRFFDRPTRVTGLVTAAKTYRAGEDYRQDLGLSLAARGVTDASTSYQFNVSVTDQDYRDSPTFSANSANSGVVSRVAMSRQKTIDDARFMQFDLSFAVKNAAVSSETNQRLSAGVSYSFEISPPAGTKNNRPWVGSLGATLSKTDYEQTSLPTIYSFPQEDLELSLKAGLEVPLSENLGVLLDLTASKTNSNYDIGEIENVGVSVGLARRF